MKSDLVRALETHLRQAGLPIPQGIGETDTETVFRGISGKRRWQLDGLYPDVRVVVEVEGGTFSRKGAHRCPACGQTPTGRHTTGTGYESDCCKYTELALLGYRVIRVTGAMIADGRAVDYIRLALGQVEVTG